MVDDNLAQRSFSKQAARQHTLENRLLQKRQDRTARLHRIADAALGGIGHVSGRPSHSLRGQVVAYVGGAGHASRRRGIVRTRTSLHKRLGERQGLRQRNSLQSRQRKEYRAAPSSCALASSSVGSASMFFIAAIWEYRRRSSAISSGKRRPESAKGPRSRPGSTICKAS